MSEWGGGIVVWCQWAGDESGGGGGDVTGFCRVTGVVVCVDDETTLSLVDIFASDASASGKFGGVTGVLDGVRICTHTIRYITIRDDTFNVQSKADTSQLQLNLAHRTTNYKWINRKTQK